MISKAAIEKAIQGGWEPFKSIKMAELECGIVGSNTLHCNIKPDKTGAYPRGFCSLDLHRAALSPSFWQALGVARGSVAILPIEPCTNPPPTSHER